MRGRSRRGPKERARSASRWTLEAAWKRTPEAPFRSVAARRPKAPSNHPARRVFHRGEHHLTACGSTCPDPAVRFAQGEAFDEPPGGPVRTRRRTAGLGPESLLQADFRIALAEAGATLPSQQVSEGFRFRHLRDASGEDRRPSIGSELPNPGGGHRWPTSRHSQVQEKRHTTQITRQ